MLIAAGLSSVTLPEDIPEEDKKLFDELVQAEQAPQRQNMLTATQPPSAGGQGEVRASMVDKIVEDNVIAYLNEVLSPEALELPQEEYGELLATHTPFGPDLVDSLSGYYEMLYDQREDKALLIASVGSYIREQVSLGVEAATKEVAKMLSQAKNDALDNPSELSDNFLETANKIVLELFNQLEKTVRM